MPTDPSDPKSPSPYQTTSTASKGGSSGIFFVIVLVLVLGGGAAYYFLAGKQATPAAVTPTASTGAPPPVASPSPTPNKPKEQGYSKDERQQYITKAVEAFKALRQSKGQPYTDAFAALTSAGGFNAATLTSKDAINARREMVKKCIAANEDYITFIKGEEAAYTAELKKTPLTPNDVEVEGSYAGAKMPTDKIVQLRTLQNESLATGDQMLAYLDSKFGAWSVNSDKRTVFKKSADAAPFTALAKTYNDQVVAINKLRDEINTVSAEDPTAAPPTPGGTPGVAPAASVAATPSATP